MSQPNERDMRQAAQVISTSGVELHGGERHPTLRKTIAAAIANARTEGAEAMREKCAEFADFHIRTTKNPLGLGDLLRTLPTPEGDTTTTERGEESGDLLAECREIFGRIQRDRFEPDKWMYEVRALLARLPKGKETPTP